MLPPMGFEQELETHLRARATLIVVVTPEEERAVALVKAVCDAGRRKALAWDADIVEYVEGNGFFESYRGPGDDFFGSVGSRPEIYPIYWSRAQMEARQSDRMARVQHFLNGLWRHESDGRTWFDPARDSLYPDRIRRRPPGADSGGLGTHLDPGTLDRLEAHRRGLGHGLLLAAALVAGHLVPTTLSSVSPGDCPP